MLLDEEVVSASSGKKIHRLVGRKTGLEIGNTVHRCATAERDPGSFTSGRVRDVRFARSGWVVIAHIRLRGARTNRSGDGAYSTT